MSEQNLCHMFLDGYDPNQEINKKKHSVLLADNKLNVWNRSHWFLQDLDERGQKMELTKPPVTQSFLLTEDDVSVPLHGLQQHFDLSEGEPRFGLQRSFHSSRL